MNGSFTVKLYKTGVIFTWRRFWNYNLNMFWQKEGELDDNKLGTSVFATQQHEWCHFPVVSLSILNDAVDQ